MKTRIRSRAQIPPPPLPPFFPMTQNHAGTKSGLKRTTEFRPLLDARDIEASNIAVGNFDAAFLPAEIRTRLLSSQPRYFYATRRANLSVSLINCRSPSSQTSALGECRSGQSFAVVVARARPLRLICARKDLRQIVN